MKKFSEFAVDFLKEEDGPSAIEYVVMLVLIIVVCMAAVSTLDSAAQGNLQANTPPQ